MTFVDSVVPSDLRQPGDLSSRGSVDQLSRPDQLIPDGGCEGSSPVSCYTGPSGTLNVGACKAGERRCQSGAWSSCIGQVVPATEVCDGKDNDCDGFTDESLSKSCYTGPSGTKGVGLCKAGTQTCAAGSWGSCTGQVLPVTEICDGKNNDCDGSTDESLSKSCYTGAAGTKGVGLCKAGTQICAAGSWGSCTSQVLPGTEVCDGKDNNCDGSTDEDFWAAVRYPPFTTLSSIHPGCTPAEPSSGACMSASSNFCKAQAPGGFVGGFGVQDMGPGTALVTCMADASYRQLPIASLTAHHESCTMSTAFSAPCFAAIHRHCTSLGFVSGVGPVEINGIANVLDFICTKHAQNLAVPWMALSSPPGCGPTTSVSPACAAAVNYYCVNQGFATGFGPVEIDTSTALIACMRKS